MLHNFFLALKFEIVEKHLPEGKFHLPEKKCDHPQKVADEDRFQVIETERTHFPSPHKVMWDTITDFAHLLVLRMNLYTLIPTNIKKQSEAAA